MKDKDINRQTQEAELLRLKGVLFPKKSKPEGTKSKVEQQ